MYPCDSEILYENVSLCQNLQNEEYHYYILYYADYHSHLGCYTHNVSTIVQSGLHQVSYITFSDFF